MKVSDGAVVPGNAEIETAEREHRIDTYYHPYHRAVSGQIDAFLDKGIVPVLISLHSFTESWRGEARASGIQPFYGIRTRALRCR